MRCGFGSNPDPFWVRVRPKSDPSIWVPRSDLEERKRRRRKRKKEKGEKQEDPTQIVSGLAGGRKRRGGEKQEDEGGRRG